MPTYTVHAPPPRKSETTSAPERFKFVRDGFHFWAFVLPPAWLLVHRLWLALVIYLVGYTVLGVALALFGAPSNVQFLVGLLIAVLMGFEVSSIRRWSLSRRGWKMLGFVVGENEESAERRFFAAWASRPAPAPETPAPSEPVYAMPTRRDPPAGNDVLGLFPQPGGSR